MSNNKIKTVIGQAVKSVHEKIFKRRGWTCQQVYKHTCFVLKRSPCKSKRRQTEICPEKNPPKGGSGQHISSKDITCPHKKALQKAREGRQKSVQ